MMRKLLWDWLTEDERRYLAMHARYASQREEDFRYWHRDPVERERLRLRWREIADALHEDRWDAGRPLGERISNAVAQATANPGHIIEVKPS